VAAAFKNNTITGEILHRDHYGNLVTNIPATVLVQSGWRTGMALEFLVKYRVATAKFADRYGAVAKGEFVLVLNGQGLLELARYMASAGDSLNAMAGDSVLVRLAGSAAPVPAPPANAEVSGPISERAK
jgi:S-adenosylmethionine hydrolase